MTRSDLRALGKSRREQCSRASHSEWSPGADRLDPVHILRGQEAGRDPDLVPIRYGRMLESPFRFFRGTAAIMAADLASTVNTGINVQACGDAHAHNFGIYASPERHVVFDINDFDETLPAPWEFDLKRLLASIVLNCRETGFNKSFALEAVNIAARGYRDVSADLATQTSLDAQFALVSEQNYLAGDISDKIRKDVEKDVDKARKRTRYQAFRKWCQDDGGVLRFRDDPPLLTRLPDEQAEQFHDMFNRYRETLQSDRARALREYRFRDAARRVVGVGSVGLGAYALLLEGRGDHDPLIIQVKEARSSVLTPYVGRSGHDKHGKRVVHGQRLMQAVSDPFLGWVQEEGRDFYMRQIRDMKGKTRSATDSEIFLADAEVTGGTLARAHARSVDPSVVSGYIGDSDRLIDAVASYAFAYADQAESDYETLSAAAHRGDIPVERGI